MTRLPAFFAALPRGRTLPDESWNPRHRVILGLLWLHVGFLWIFGALTGHAAGQSGLVAGGIALAALLASWPQRGHRFRAVFASLGLLMSSAGLVHFSGGIIEMHFHFFVMVAVIALYQDWTPFLVAIALVVVHHGVGSLLEPGSVFNHPSALAHPWLWALIHGGFIVGMSAASLVNWRLNEAEYTRRIHEQERADKVVRDSEAQFRSLVQNAADIIAVVNEDGSLRYASPSHQRLLGFDATKLNSPDALEQIHPEDRVLLQQAFANLVLHREGSHAVEIRVRSKDQTWRTLDIIATNRLEDPATAGIVVNARDITDRKALEDQLVYQALHDPLTGLPNRALFMDRLAHSLARAGRSADRPTVLYLDFDLFKDVNDSLGHPIGDLLLVAMARRLSNCIRSGDTVARLGGDEFAILLEATGAAEAVDLARRINLLMVAPFDLGGQVLNGSVSIGIACSLSPEDSADELVRNADIAMYVSKKQAKGQFSLYDASMYTNGLERLKLESELRQALDRGEFRVFYQPIFNLTTGALDEVEALVRWQHPQRGLVSPGEFIPLAEENGLIVPIGLWVLSEACRQVCRWQSEQVFDQPLALSVNISPRMFQHPALLDDVAAVLSVSGIAPGSLRLEITEGVIMQNSAASALTMRQLKALGVQLVMDDFGTGYSSLATLQSFPFDVLKIDQSFVRVLQHGTESVAIVQAIISLAASLNLTVTGEGIETADQLELLHALGSDHGQGYLFSRPLPPDELAPFLAQRRAIQSDHAFSGQNDRRLSAIRFSSNRV